MTQMNGSAFRRSLEDRILSLHRETGIPISRYRKIVAFNRFLARLVAVDSESWVLKGGYMMELVFHQSARSTKDIDLLFTQKTSGIQKILLKVCKVPLADWFSFEIGAPASEHQGDEKTVRYPLKSLLDSRTFETFHVDINSYDLLIQKPVKVISKDIINLPEFPSFRIPCYPIEQQIAEKIHALTRSYGSNEASRVKDLVDILLIADTRKLKSISLRKAIIATFQHRNMHEFPGQAPKISSLYTRNYSRLANEIGIKQQSLEEANAALNSFLSPILATRASRTWDPIYWKWS